MEQISTLEHPTDEALKALWRGDLSVERVECILAHLDRCGTCDCRLEQLEPAIEEYRRYLAFLDRRVLPPPGGWPDMRTAMEVRDSQSPASQKEPAPVSQLRRRVARVVWMAAIAAGILLCVLFVPRGASVARAETLLAKARESATRAPSREHSRLRVSARTRSFLRAAV